MTPQAYSSHWSRGTGLYYRSSVTCLDKVLKKFWICDWCFQMWRFSIKRWNSVSLRAWGPSISHSRSPVVLGADHLLPPSRMGSFICHNPHAGLLWLIVLPAHVVLALGLLGICICELKFICTLQVNWKWVCSQGHQCELKMYSSDGRTTNVVDLQSKASRCWLPGSL